MFVIWKKITCIILIEWSCLFAGLVLPAAVSDTSALHQHLFGDHVLQAAHVASARGARAPLSRRINTMCKTLNPTAKNHYLMCKIYKYIFIMTPLLIRVTLFLKSNLNVFTCQ